MGRMMAFAFVSASVEATVFSDDDGEVLVLVRVLEEDGLWPARKTDRALLIGGGVRKADVVMSSQYAWTKLHDVPRRGAMRRATRAGGERVRVRLRMCVVAMGSGLSVNLA
jgi:hypothetical protein